MDKKAFTFKFYQKEIKFDYEKAKAKMDAILYDNKEILQNIEIYDDYEKTIGYHFNGTLQSTSCITFLRKYKLKGPQKDRTVFMFMKDLPQSEMPHWKTYCLKRQCECNVHRLNF